MVCSSALIQSNNAGAFVCLFFSEGRNVNSSLDYDVTKNMAVWSSEVPICSDICKQVIFYPMLCRATRLMKQTHSPSLLSCSQASCHCIGWLFHPASTGFLSSHPKSNPVLAAAVPPVKPGANWIVGNCSCLFQGCTKLVCVWLWKVSWLSPAEP